MTLTDISISARLTIATTALVLLVFGLVSVSVLWSVNGLYEERARLGEEQAPAANRELTALLGEASQRTIATTGTLLAEVAGAASDPAASPRLSTLVAQLEQDPVLAFVDVQDAAGASLLGKGAPPAAGLAEFPITRDGQPAGRVLIAARPEGQSALGHLLAERETAVSAAAAQQRQVAMALLVAVLVLSAFLTGLVFYIVLVRLAKRFILNPAERIRDGLNRIRGALWGMEQRRDFSERLEPGPEDELGNTVIAFNKALDFLERQNDQLNDSIIEMLQISSEISQARDLTLRLPVKEDITGPLGDALNRITSESARVLVQVREVAERVGRAAVQVQAQGRQVVAVADAERSQIEQTANDLAAAVEAIDQIGELAQFCNKAAGKATHSNEEAMTAVRGAVQGMGAIRTSIEETGKRIKRLGERSQEISGIVDILNSFSERTHVLAINASMQAATAGEAGRGFAVVAQEVQRLADSSRNATNQIATLIRNIQVETQDTIQTVNQATEAVGHESRTIEGAGERMLATQQTTANLADAVRQIDSRAQTQVSANRSLMTRVESMRASTVETTDQIELQSAETNSLVDYSQQLLDAIRLFRLPAPGPAAGAGGA
jgi:methyl-accepting chemotaxis protein